MDEFEEEEASCVIRYALAQKALVLAKEMSEHKLPPVYKSSYGFFGMQMLFSLFENETFKQSIAPKLDISLSEFTQLAKQYPIFYIDPPPLPSIKTRAKALLKEIGQKIKETFIATAYAKLHEK